jgi:hypothetical protein
LKKKPIEKPQTKKPAPISKPSLQRVGSEESIENLKAQLAFQHDDHSVDSNSMVDEPDIDFGHIVNEDGPSRSHPAKKDGGKVQRIKKLLQEAERKRERLKALTKSSEEADHQKARSEQWQDVLRTAAGEKTLMVDPTADGLSKAEIKLKKALKKREKKKQKSSEEWAARLDKVKEDKEAKLTKREENIQNRKQSKHGGMEAPAEKKKVTTISKPGQNNKKEQSTKGQQEKKVKNRAGFEGKKASFLNSNK